MKIDLSSIIKSLIIITILFVVFVFGAYAIKKIFDDDGEKSLSIKSTDSLVINLVNNLPLSDSLAISNEKNSVSDDIFKNIKFELVNNDSKDLNYELYITKKELEENEINGKYIKFYLTKQNGEELKGYNKNRIPLYDDLLVVDDLPGSRILYRGSIKGNSVEKFDFKTWISDNYSNNNQKEEFSYSIRVRVV